MKSKEDGGLPDTQAEEAFLQSTKEVAKTRHIDQEDAWQQARCWLTPHRLVYVNPPEGRDTRESEVKGGLTQLPGDIPVPGNHAHSRRSASKDFAGTNLDLEASEKKEQNCQILGIILIAWTGILLLMIGAATVVPHLAKRWYLQE